ncbi:MAG: glycosyltransferase family 39 protein [Actinomycetota bacterium]|nr:glycosyltransferase family 39 protein [Actinomycetota bacterium]
MTVLDHPAPAFDPPAATPPAAPIIDGADDTPELDERPADPRWARPALIALLLGTGVLYMWGLSAQGWANDFYSAAVQAGTKSWKAFFFGSSDSANFITVDKPPASLWVMELSARIFGVNSWSILVPQALEGVAAVGLLYLTIKRWFGAAAGLIAGAVMALTPVAAMMFRYNNPDALMVLLMVAAAYAVTRAIEDGKTKWLVWAGVFLGFGFLTKMLQAFTVLPTFALAYLIAGPPKLAKRIWQLLVAGGALIVAMGWWIAIVELWPADSRPYIGGSEDNSVLNLVFGYNGFGRLTGDEPGSVGGGGQGGGGSWGPTGWTRMFNDSWGGQASWLIPAALLFAVVGLAIAGRGSRQDRIRAAIIIWGGWLFVTGAVFSLGEGIIHEYYAIALAPGIGAMIGIGVTMMWKLRRLWWSRAIMAAAVGISAWWAYVLLNRTPDWNPWLRTAILAAAAMAIVGLAIGNVATGWALAAAAVVGLLGPAAYTIETVASAQGGAIPLAGPVGQGVRGGPGGRPGNLPGRPGQPGQPGGITIGQPGQPGQPGQNGQPGQPSQPSQNGQPGQPGQLPVFPGNGNGQLPVFPGNGNGYGQPPAGVRPGGQGGGGLLNAGSPSDEIVQFLKDGQDGFTWALATIGANNAAGYQLATGDPVMAIGGFNGTDQWPTLEAFQQMVADGEIHYYAAGGAMGGPGGGNNAASTSGQISTWVTANFETVTVDGQTFYDLTQPSS